jgi:hypothetical protein
MKSTYFTREVFFTLRGAVVDPGRCLGFVNDFSSSLSLIDDGVEIVIC